MGSFCLVDVSLVLFSPPRPLPIVALLVSYYCKVMDVWQPSHSVDFVPSKRAYGSAPLNKLARSLELYVWDIRGRIAALKDWCMYESSFFFIKSISLSWQSPYL